MEEIDLDQIAREAADPNSIKASLDTGIRKIFEDKSKLPQQKRKDDQEEEEKSHVTKKGKVSKTFCQIDKIFVLTQSFESTFIWAMHN